jgi:2-dehydro-3-deoxy-D-arabinonate dehydratase
MAAMQLAKIQIAGNVPQIALVEGDNVIPLGEPGAAALTQLLEATNVSQAIAELSRGAPLPLRDARLLPPLDQHEVWAAGVTYRRSKVARMEESEGAAKFYDLVYAADRPELFFKATPYRVVGPGQPVRIRRDAHWNVPEPELALVLNSRLQIVGYTVGNDMSSRDIEGENPLYLPQAKVYDACCALGPWITLAPTMPALESVGIRLRVTRAGSEVFSGETNVGQITRKMEDLVAWLGRDNSFPSGAILLTGTGIVPTESFTLRPGDEIAIEIDGIGTLTNSVVQG